MGLMDSIERGLERAVNGAFAKTFRGGGVQPVEIAAALKRELDIKAVAVDRDRVLAPNIFTVRLAQKDADRLAEMGDTLTSELEQTVAKHAGSQGYKLLGPAAVNIAVHASIPTGTVEILSQRPDANVAWQAALELEGKRHLLRTGTTIVGRGTDAHVRISDSAASRKHLEIVWDGKHALARDLGSTNGSKIDGQRFREAQLQPDTVIYIGQTPLRFKFVPAAANTQSSRAQNGQNAGFWGQK